MMNSVQFLLPSLSSPSLTEGHFLLDSSGATKLGRRDPAFTSFTDPAERLALFTGPELFFYAITLPSSTSPRQLTYVASDPALPPCYDKCLTPRQ